jgi:hypothetical protein
MDPRMYVLMRTDLASMNSGKGMAHSHHAGMVYSNDMWKRLQTGEKMPKGLMEWQKQTEQGFGTTLTLDVPDETTMLRLVDVALMAGYTANIVLDPTYPVTDGKVTHLLPVYTCAYVFSPDGSPWFLSTLPLHP